MGESSHEMLTQFAAQWMETYKILGIPEKDRLDLNTEADQETLQDIAQAMYKRFRSFTKDQFYSAWIKTTMELRQTYPRWTPAIMQEEVFKRIQCGDPIPASRQLQSKEEAEKKRQQRQFVEDWKDPSPEFIQETAKNLVETTKLFGEVALTQVPQKFWGAIYAALDPEEQVLVANRAEDEYRGRLLSLSIFSAEVVNKIVSGEFKPDWHQVRQKHGQGYFEPYYLNIKRECLLNAYVKKLGL